MGCVPSKIKRESNEIRIELEEHRGEIEKLKAENDALRRGVGGRTNYAASDDDEDQLMNELDALRKENEKLQEEIVNLKKGNSQLIPSINTSSVESSGPPPTSSLPKVGDAVLSMWEVSMWQYFTATIVNFNAKTLKFEIIWDDQDPSGRIVDYYNLALDRVPDDDEVAVGSIVLFPQGQYKGQEGVRLGGQRWHQGKITSVSKGDDGAKLYSGEHTKGEEDGKWITFKGYEIEFNNLRRDQLRIAPNVLDLLSAEASNAPASTTGTDEDAADLCDIFISYSKLNSSQAVRNNELSNQGMPPSYDEALAAMCDPRDIRNQLQQNGLAVNQESTGDLMKTVKMIHNAKVVIAFLSDEYAQDEICRQEFQYAKKTAKKPVIPVVVGESFEWMMSVVGLLIAGELYIHFKDKTVQEMKMKELLKAVSKSVPSGDSTDAVVASVPKQLPTPDVFVSYCWSNSNKALQSQQIPNLVGNEFADARRIKEDLSKSGDLALWLDIERLQTTNQSDESMSMFQQIAKGLNTAKVVIVFVSAEYAKSDNCRSEFQFALKSLKKPIVPVVVGKDSTWRDTVIGLLVSSQETEIIDMQSITSEGNYHSALEKIEKSVRSILGTKKERPKQKQNFRAPMIGDHVICHHTKWAFYYATIESFDEDTLEYTVNWDDKDPSGRQETYKNVAIDTVPIHDQIGVDSIVFFPQGSYGGTEGNNAGGGRFHQGQITNIHKEASGVTLYDGHHTKGDDDGKWVTYRDYSYNFTNLKIEELRIAPNAMDALMACEQAFSLDE